MGCVWIAVHRADQNESREKNTGEPVAESWCIYADCRVKVV